MTEFHPSLFRRKCKAEGPAEIDMAIKPAPIPQNTLYEEPLVSQHRVKKRYVTVYGFTPANMETVLDMIRSCGDILEIEYGKNWVNVLFGGEDGIKKCLRMNTSIVGDEMIGVFRQGGGVVEDKDIFVRHKGIFTSMMEYFFGD